MSETNLTQDEYIDAGGQWCPVCRSMDTEGGPVNIDHGTATQPMSCNECDAQWTDTYHLSGYGDLETNQ